MVKGLHIDITIPSEEYLKLYEGVAKNVRVTSLEGLSVEFPARILQPFLTHTGIRGRFIIYFDENNKFKGIDRL